MSDLKKHFNNEAESFDDVVRKNIACYDDMLTALINAIPDKRKNPRILDLGCGTGNITLKALSRFPEAEVTCLDLSENMLEIAKHKLSDYEKVDYVLGDFTKMELNSKFDVVLSSLALHHIESEDEKELMYKNIYDVLEKDGVFYNADVIKANSSYIEELNNKIAVEDMKSNGVSDEEIINHKSKRDSNDIPTTIFNHIKMLENVGFEEIDIIWKYYSNAVYGGTKK